MSLSFRVCVVNELLEGISPRERALIWVALAQSARQAARDAEARPEDIDPGDVLSVSAGELLLYFIVEPDEKALYLIDVRSAPAREMHAL